MILGAAPADHLRGFAPTWPIRRRPQHATWRAMLRQRLLFPRASAAFVTDGGAAAPRESRTTRRSSLQFQHERGAEAPIENLGGRCSVGAHFSRAPARLCRLDGGGAAPRRSRTTRRSSLQFQHERGASAPIETPWRAERRRRPFFPCDSAALSAGWGRGFAPQKSDDTKVVPPVLLRARRGSAHRNTWRAMR